MRLTFSLLTFLHLPALSLSRTIITPTESTSIPPYTSRDYDTVYPGRCADSSSATDTVISSHVQWAPVTEYTYIDYRKWTTIYPEPTPTSYPTDVAVTFISTHTVEYYLTGSLGDVDHWTLELAIVSFSFQTNMTTRPSALAMPTDVVGQERGCRTVG
ncbi:hypothetical protein MMYC01_208589 [Madurella mycetomatis]|uniref:Uncharacterized protein n=1 Tax=Madurella mycetomatis TaxID=100816 RepID=A0A175VVA3_9PEZI|nr:hypothetical protein MMYC01_208589 [Madurella mycetomatis]